MPNHIHFILFCLAQAGAHASAPLPEIIKMHLLCEIIYDSAGAPLPEIIKIHLLCEIICDSVGATLSVRPNNPAKMIEKWLFELENKYPGITIDYYVMMPNHIHFILFCLAQAGAHASAPLPEIIKWFKTQTTNDYIKGVKTGNYPPFDKHIWQRNYFEHIIRNEQDLYEIRKYIDENPLKWKEDELY